jgi:hypothetical protein
MWFRSLISEFIDEHGSSFSEQRFPIKFPWKKTVPMIWNKGHNPFVFTEDVREKMLYLFDWTERVAWSVAAVKKRFCAEPNLQIGDAL